MEGNEKHEKTFLGISDIYSIIKCTYWHVTFELVIGKQQGSFVESTCNLL